MTRHWWLFQVVFLAAVLAVAVWLYGCGEFRVGVKPVAPDQPTTQPYVKIERGDTTGDPWLSYALVAAVVVVALLSPPPWQWRRCRREDA